jgi:hypothetical protein
MKQVKLTRQAGHILMPATDYDKDILEDISLGETIEVRYKKCKPRSIQHHKLYFGGLLGMALEYWEPTGGLVSSAEEAIVREYTEYLCKYAGDQSVLRDVANSFIDNKKYNRRKYIEACPTLTKEQLHEWVKIEAGYYDVIVTPGGIKKKAQSISFSKMNQDEFNQFYKLAFGVVWNFILSQVFENKQECQDAIHQLMSMS